MSGSATGPLVIEKLSAGRRRFSADGPEFRRDVERIRAGLRDVGVVHIRARLGRQAFFRIAEAIGSVWRELIVKIIPGRKEYVAHPSRVNFHCDSARSNVLAWLCEVPGPDTSRNLYLDARDAFQRLDADERKLLRGVSCRDPLQVGGANSTGPPVPVVSEDGTRFFWIARQVIVPADNDARAALARFKSLLAGERDAKVIAVKMRQGESVFVDNNRFLHGRDPLPPTSKRQLYRLYINTDGWDGAERARLRAPTPETA